MAALRGFIAAERKTGPWRTSRWTISRGRSRRCAAKGAVFDSRSTPTQEVLDLCNSCRTAITRIPHFVVVWTYGISTREIGQRRAPGWSKRRGGGDSSALSSLNCQPRTDLSSLATAYAAARSVSGIRASRRPVANRESPPTLEMPRTSVRMPTTSTDSTVTVSNTALVPGSSGGAADAAAG